MDTVSGVCDDAPECVCACVWVHLSASPAIDIQIASCEKLNQEAVEVAAPLSLWSRRGARVAFDMVMRAHCGDPERQMDAGIHPRCLCQCVIYLAA